MNDSAKNKEELKAILEIGLTIQSISTIVAFCIKKEKKEFLEKLNQLITELNQSLSDEEKNELKEDINKMIEQKSEEFLTELSLEMEDDEVKKVVEQIKSFSSD